MNERKVRATGQRRKAELTPKSASGSSDTVPDTHNASGTRLVVCWRGVSDVESRCPVRDGQQLQ